MPPKKKQIKTDLEIVLIDTDKLVPNPRNANQHDAEQVGQIAGSILSFGWTDPIIIWQDGMIIAGHGRHKAAQMLKVDKVPCVDCSHMNESEARAFALAHNRIARNSTLDLEMLGNELRDLSSQDWSLTDLGFNQSEMDEALAGLQEEIEEEQRYTEKVESPVYEITGEQPAVSALADNAKTDELVAEINQADLPDEITDFLLKAAARHTVFDYRNIAEFYAHADEATQRLMERSALVVIDYDQAIEDGFVKLIGAVSNEYEKISA